MNTTKLSLALIGGIAAVALAAPSFAQARRPAAPAAAAPAAAAPAAGQLVPGIGIADIDGIVASSAAARAAAQQQQTTYKAQIDAIDARQKQLNAQLEPLVAKYNADAKAAKPDVNALNTQAAAIQQLNETGRQELNTLAQPIALSRAYVTEQIEGRIGAAVNAVLARRNISILLSPQALITATNPGYDLSRDILAELDRALPSVQIVPPAGWEPRQVREAKAQQAQAAGAAAAPARPAGPQPSGR